MVPGRELDQANVVFDALALDLGGLHTARSGTVKLDDVQPPLVEGNTYRLDFFHAERHSTSESVLANEISARTHDVPHR